MHLAIGPDNEVPQAEKVASALAPELSHAARLALVGELAASIVHEIQQPLMAILVNATAGLERLRGVETSTQMRELCDILHDIHDQSAAATAIVESIRNLTRKRPLQLRMIDVNEVTRDVLRLVIGDAKRRHVTLDAQLAPHLPVIAADRVCVQQVLLNLLVNALEATDQNGVRERVIGVRTREEGAAIEIAVSDTGHGISAENLPRLFNAFFTTKKDGVGLGLSISSAIATAHGGRLWAEPRSGGGARFRLSLPIRSITD